MLNVPTDEDLKWLAGQVAGAQQHMTTHEKRQRLLDLMKSPKLLYDIVDLKGGWRCGTKGFFVDMVDPNTKSPKGERLSCFCCLFEGVRRQYWVRLD